MKEKTYHPKKFEEKIYQKWEREGYFNPEKLPGKRKKKFVVLLPPPNVTGSLHLGHALNSTIQDILVRKKRMEGYKALWVPGTDHAGIATQYVVEKELKKEGKTRFEVGREKFVEMIWEWVKKYGEIILTQFKKLGCSLDWSRKRFTLDENYQKSVKEAFLALYQEGLIYKSKRPINWCVNCKSSLSDLELERKEIPGNLWFLDYKTIIVATTRPETIFGDVAVAVNPKDKRYKKLIGKKATIPIIKKEIPIIADERVDPQFGTGAVKITPAHDLLDFEIAQRHQLPLVIVINNEGKMIGEIPPQIRGMPTKEARKFVLELLEKEGKIKKIEAYSLSLPVCYRCSSPIEIIPSEQWFLKTELLNKEAIKEIEKKKIKIYPPRFKKILIEWLKTSRDWCISRQIWWGHQIPLEKEKDVLDTWFSSALWPLAVFGWPKNTPDLEEYFPTHFLSTARDIINLWVGRMIIFSLKFVKKIPFKVVLIHPTVLTKEGKRMSKSLGTGIDPLVLIEKYGADATRFGLIWQVKGGQDLKFDENFCETGKRFCNKLWNASRFVILNLENKKFKKAELRIEKLTPKTKSDEKIVKKLKELIPKVNKEIENFEFGKAIEKIYHFFWHEFCDKYIEASKNQLKNENQKENTQKILLSVLFSTLKILHPFIPFITEVIYQELPINDKENSLMIESWPKN